MKVRRVDYYPDEYVVGVCRMGFEQQGVYWMICSLIMSHGGPIENDPKWIGNLGGMGAAKCRRAISDLVGMGKLIENGGKIGQKRAENELKNAQKRIETARENGEKGGRPSKPVNRLAEPAGFSDEKLTTNYQLPTNNESPKGDPPVSPKGGKPSKPPTTGSFIDPEWQPSESDFAYALEQLGAGSAVNVQAENFRDYWIAATGARARKRDWSATWRQWVRRAATEAPRVNGHHARSQKSAAELGSDMFRATLDEWEARSGRH